MVFAGYSGFLHYIQLASHQLATFGINVTKSKILKSKSKFTLPCIKGQNCLKYAQFMLNTRLSQQGIWVSFGHPNPKTAPRRTPKCFYEELLKNFNLKQIIEFFHLCIIPLTLYKDIMPYFVKFIMFMVGSILRCPISLVIWHDWG